MKMPRRIPGSIERTCGACPEHRRRRKVQKLTGGMVGIPPGSFSLGGGGAARAMRSKCGKRQERIIFRPAQRRRPWQSLTFRGSGARRRRRPLPGCRPPLPDFGEGLLGDEGPARAVASSPLSPKGRGNQILLPDSHCAWGWSSAERCAANAASARSGSSSGEAIRGRRKHPSGGGASLKRLCSRRDLRFHRVAERCRKRLGCAPAAVASAKAGG
jgi:hypothetical protein